MLKIKDLEKKTINELLKEISTLKGKLLLYRFQSSTGQLTEIHVIKNTRRDIGRVFTVLKQKQAQEAIAKQQEGSSK